MPASHAIAVEKNQALDAYRKIRNTYKGGLSQSIIESLLPELRDVVPKGRYVGRNGSKPVCVLQLSYDREVHSIEGVQVEFVNIDRSRGEQRLPIADFLASYRFFAPDCA